MATMVKMRLSNSPGWTLSETLVAGRMRRVAEAMPTVDPFARQLEATERVEIVHVGAVAPDLRRGAAPVTGMVAIDADVPLHETHVLMVRHESGAIAFHYSSDVPSRRGGRSKGTKTIRFAVPVSEEAVSSAGRRGIVTSILKTALLKIAGKLADIAMPALSRLWEKSSWKLAKREEGWKQVSPTALGSKALLPLKDFSKISSDPAKPNLLLIHGTFSNALSAYRDLAATRGSNGNTLFEAVTSIYGDRIRRSPHYRITSSATPIKAKTGTAQ
jgi:hypothetical protein